MNLREVLHLESEESRHALGLSLVLFALTSSYTLVKTARDALFLSHLPAQVLPYVYLGVGVITTVVALVFTRSTRQRSALQTFEWALVGSAIVLAAFAWAFESAAHWVVVTFYFWASVYGLVLLSQFWLYANAVSNPIEAKRTFGIAGAGGILGGLAAGLAAQPLVRTWSVPSLITVASMLLAVAILALRTLLSRREETFGQTALDGDDVERPLRGSYARWLAAAALCSVVVTGLLDFQLKVEVQQRAAGADAIASFFGWFYTVTNLAAIVLQVFATRWALGALGATWSAAMLPAGLAIGAVTTFLVPSAMAVIGTRLWDQVLRVSLNKSSTELFFFPLPPEIRRRVKAIIEAGIERLGDAFAGLVILGAAASLGTSTRVIAGLAAVLVALWIVAWLGVRRGYVRELGRNLRRMNLDPRGAGVSLRESHLIQEMMRLMESPHERVVLHGIDLLREAAPERLQRELPRLLDHPSALVRLEALTRIVTVRDPELEARVEHLLYDPDPEVRVAALRARCLLDGTPSLDLVSEYLDSSDLHLRRSALRCMIEVATPVEEPRVRVVIERVLRDGDVADRVAIAEALAHRPPDSELHAFLAALTRDATPSVRNAALVSAGRAGRRALVPRLIEALGAREFRAAARHGLVAFGDRVVGTLADYLADTSVDLEIRRQLPRVLGEIGTAEAAMALLRSRDRSDVRLSYRTLKAMNHIRAHNRSVHFPRDLVSTELEYDVRSHVFAFVHYRSCPIGSARTAERLLCIALNERMDQALNRIFRRLALLYPSEETHASYRGIISENPRLRGNALEYLENALAPDHAAWVLPLVDDSGDEGKLRFAESRFGLRFLNPVQSLAELLESDDAWLRTCALYVVGSQRQHSLASHVEDHLGARESHVRETALWAHAALATG